MFILNNHVNPVQQLTNHASVRTDSRLERFVVNQNLLSGRKWFLRSRDHPQVKL